MKRKICQFKASTIAMAPDILSECINKYSTKYESHIIGHKLSKGVPEAGTVLLHCHNKVPANFRVARTIVQYHSEPFQVSLNPAVNKKLVISQYHATLPEYAGCKIVRNIIDFKVPEYDPIVVDDKIRIGYSPSRTNILGKWHNKGYDQTVNVLNALKAKYPDKVEIDIITKASLPDCIARKAKCNVIIDECVTSSYHRSGLEGLALGKLTICSVGPKVEEVLKNAAGTFENPFENVEIGQLLPYLESLVEGGVEPVLAKGLESRKWMEDNWSPELIIKEFEDIYDSVIG